MFTLNEIGEKVAQSRYYQKDENGKIIENWDDLVNRVVKHVCVNESEDFKNKLINLIGKTEFLPNSPCLVNAGRKTNKAGLMACYVSKAPEDSWDSMVATIKNFGDVARAGGGCGLFLGNIRPEGSKVFGSTHAKACGPIEHMRMISEVMSSITQSGFRGMAMISTLNVSHPDIIKFIKCKQKERALKTYLREDIFNQYPQIIDNLDSQLKVILDKFLYNFNISVLISDKFMDAVEKDLDWNLEFNGKVYSIIKAKEIFDLICENAWKNGDPGILFEDTINKNSPYRFSGQKINCSNPCQPGWAVILTPNGLSTIDKLNIGDKVWSCEGWTNITNKQSTGIKEVKEYRTTSGKFIGTSSHRVVSGGSKIEVEKAKSIDYLCGEYKTNFNINPQDVMDGLVLGDGTLHKASNNLVLLCIGNKDKDYFNSEISYLIKKHRPGIKECCYEITTTIVHEELDKTYKRKIPDRFKFGNYSTVCGFLRGIYSANGSINNVGRVTLKTSSKEILDDVQMMLSSIGILSYFTSNKPNIVKFSNGEYECKKSYDLNITTDIDKFAKNIGFIQKYKIELLNKFVENKRKGSCKIKGNIISINRISEEEVYSITVNNQSRTYWTSGCNVSNCGEQTLPSSNSNCNLGSIDVSKFFDSKKEDVDWSRLKEAIELSFRFLDDVIDVHDYPTPSFKEWAMDNRPVGLGVMGFADLLLKLKIRYGSKESVDFAEKLMEFFAKTTHEKSKKLAKERGTSKCCNYKELENRRNITTTSIAPTGTISLLAGCSSSIEPIFSAVTYRHDNTGSYEMKHPEADKKWFACVLDNDGGPKEVTWKEHVMMQAAFQKFVDASISKTINLPSSATIEDIQKIYLFAHKMNCKGLTVYRNNSKTTQILNLTNRTFLRKTEIHERPKELSCDIFKIKADGVDWHIIIGIENNSPYELFAINGNEELPQKGKIIKQKRRHYSLLDEKNNIILENIAEQENKIDPKVGLETRRFSLELRHGIPPKSIIEQIDKSNETITSFSKAAARIFKKYYFGEDVIEGSLCPECLKQNKEVKLIYTSSCVTCPTCYFSKCG